MKPSRNDPCPCGSGKKYKHCCERKAEAGPITPPSPKPTDINPLVTLYKTGRDAEAESKTRLLLEQYPNFGFGWKLLGTCLERQGKDALSALQQAATCLTDDAEAHNNLGNALNCVGRHNEAIVSCRRALKIRPDFAEAHNNLGNALNDSGQSNDALLSYRKAIQLRPDFVEAHHNLGNALSMLGRIDDATASYRRALQLRPYFSVVHSNLLFSLGYNASTTPQNYLKEALSYGERVTKYVTAKYADWRCEPKPKRLRVGVVSGDLRNHPVGYFLESVLTKIDPIRVELYAYTNNPSVDQLTARIQPYFSRWREVFALNDEAAAQLIHNDGVHVLLDLSGHTDHNFLPVFAWKPAPVQASWLGYFASTGVAEMDHLIGDAYIAPPEDESHFTENIWCLPDSYLCFTPPDVAVEPDPLPSLTNKQQITFGCFNNLTKMNDAVVALWARVLQAVPNSRLFLKTLQLNDVAICEVTRKKFAAHGIAAKRLVLEGSSPRAELLAAYQRVDIALDPFPYPGGTTSAEALWMGVPVLTKRGDRFLSHMGESIMHNAGLSDWIADDDDDYVAKAVAHTADLNRLAALRAGLRQQVLASPLFEANQFARNFEAALWGMWQNWQKQHGTTQ